MRLSYNLGVLAAILSCSNSSLAFQRAEAWGVRPAKSALFAADGSNVVLRPTYEDSEVFDSLKLGGCRVHRYKRDDFDSETEYVGTIF